jgi:serine/threonine-protein kinase HipA
LAGAAGLRVQQWRLEPVLRKPVLVIDRFDRNGPANAPDAHRVPFLSAMSMLNANDNEGHSYLEIADAIRQHGAAAAADLRELWRRMVFTVLISNTDDHLRNHGFLYDAARRGWRLSPVYDVNPTPREVRPRVLATAIDETNTTASLTLAMEVADYFDIPHAHARAIVAEVRSAVDTWRQWHGRLDCRRPRSTASARHSSTRIRGVPTRDGAVVLDQRDSIGGSAGQRSFVAAFGYGAAAAWSPTSCRDAYSAPRRPVRLRGHRRRWLTDLHSEAVWHSTLPHSPISRWTGS